ncbi:MAG: hypothetical protein SFY69_05150 [Planctomycetota bacterium]|nr:hypothetical protein [Planctomycetota bacterium]
MGETSAQLGTPNALAGALASLATAAQAVRLYGADHAAARDRVGIAAQALAGLADWPWTVTVSAEALTRDGEDVATAPCTHELAKVLHASGVGAVRATRAPSQAEVSAVAAWLGTLPAPHGADAPPAPGEEWIRFLRVDARSLAFVEGQGDGAGGGQDWQSLCLALASRSSDPVASEAVNDLERRVGAASDAERAHVTEAMQVLAEGVPGEMARERLDRLSNSLGSVNPDLRRSLLAVGISMDSPGVLRAASRLPVEDVVAAVRAIDRPGYTPPPAALRLIRSLAGQAGATQRAESALPTIGAALAELMVSRSTDEFCPEDYSANLDRAATGVGVGVALPDVKPLSLQVRCCEIAADLLAAGYADERTAQHCRVVERSVDALRGAGRLDLLLDVATHTRVLRGAAHEGAADAAARLLAALPVEALARDQVDRLGIDDGSLAAMARVIRLEAESTLARIAERVASGDLAPDHPHVRWSVSLASAASLRAVASRSGEHAIARAGLLALLGSCPAATLLEVIEPLLDTPDADLLLEVLRTLDNRLALWPAGVQRRALLHADDRIRELGAQRLERDPEACAIDVLTGLLGGTLTGALPSDATLRGCVRALVARGPEGLAALAGVLDALSTSLSQRKVAIALYIATALRPFADRGRVGESLRRWKRSPGGRIMRLLTENPLRRAA